MKYCIYANKYFNDNEMNIEHIIPKSLGGCDDFTISVNKDMNSKLGSTIDGKFSNDFLIKMKQIYANYMGHSKREPYFKIKNSRIEGSPVNVTFTKKDMEIYDPINKSIITGENAINMKTKIDMEIRFKFICKVALSGGYFLFGNKFIDHADHHSLRKAIFSNNVIDEKLDLRYYDNLHPVENKDKINVDMIKFVFKYLNTSSVIFAYSPSSIIVQVSIGGDYIGMINFKADIKHFPNDEDFRLGKVISCNGGRIIQKSFWKTIYEMNKDLDLVNIDDLELDWGNS